MWFGSKSHRRWYVTLGVICMRFFEPHQNVSTSKVSHFKNKVQRFCVILNCMHFQNSIHIIFISYAAYNFTWNIFSLMFFGPCHHVAPANRFLNKKIKILKRMKILSLRPFWMSWPQNNSKRRPLFKIKWKNILGRAHLL